MQEKEVFEKVDEIVRKKFEKHHSLHDYYHAKRVFNLALQLAEAEKADKVVCGVSALMHDWHRFVHEKTGKYCSPEQSIPEVLREVEPVGIPKEKLNAIVHCIERHEDYNFTEAGNKAETLEAKIVQDADNLDALGAIGIARTFMYGGLHNVQMYNPGENTDYIYRGEQVKDNSIIAHCKVKLLKLKDNLNTESAKKIAEERHEFVEEFVKRFLKEWENVK